MSLLKMAHQGGGGCAAALTPHRRVTVGGKFLFEGAGKFIIKGVTYGPFGADGTDAVYGAPEQVDRDFQRIAQGGFNTVRLYTVPPTWLLDTAAAHGLRVMVGLAWAQHIAFLGDRAQVRQILCNVREQVRSCQQHPAILCYAVGNEIPGHVVRWFGHRAVEAFIRRLCGIVKQEDPFALVTYVNYPSTEYLELPCLDFVSFNLYLETPQKLSDYLYRLQNIAGNRPLVVAELGLDAIRNGQDQQADVLAWQLPLAFQCGSAGVIVFSWTDQWFRGGCEIDDWAFGLTRRDREPKPALAAVQQAFAADALTLESAPMISVVICTYNGARTMARCLEAVGQLAYPNYEVIVVDDGSTDGVGHIAERFDVRLITTENLGLSNARNIGLHRANGSIIAYLDDDAYPDEHWLQHLALAFARTDHVGIGGPNIPPDDDGLTAQCVARAPGGPVHVLLTDQLAEHIPGCNMAFRVDALRAIGGFDPQFRIAGDDVDVCWRLQDRGWTLGFSPAAVVWHHRRSSVRGYWRQQRNYGKAEADLERKWPEKYNAVGHLTWNGRLYGAGFADALNWWSKRRIYHGQWGSALFQSVYHVPPTVWSMLPMMPEWYILIVLLPLLSLAGVQGPALWLPLTLAVVCIAVTLSLAWTRSADASVAPGRSAIERIKCRLLTTLLHLIQPAARLSGRIQNGLHPWRRHSRHDWVLPRSRDLSRWSEQWHSSADRVCELERGLRSIGAVVLRGGDFDDWDIEVRGGVFGAARVSHMVEDHGQNKQLARFRVRPHAPRTAVMLVIGCLALAALAGAVHSWAMMVAFAVVGILLLGATVFECGAAVGGVLAAFNPEPVPEPQADVQPPPSQSVSAACESDEPMQMFPAASRVS